MNPEDKLLKELDVNSLSELRDNIQLSIKYVLGRHTIGAFDSLNRRKTASWIEALRKHEGHRNAAQEVVRYKVNLKELLPGEQSLSDCLVYSPCTELGTTVSSIHDVKIIDSTSLAIRCTKESPLMHNLARCRDYRLPAAICFGGAVMHRVAALCPLPLGFDCCNIESMMTHRPVVVSQCLTQQIDIPSDCSAVFEGYIQKNEPKHEGLPVFHITCFSSGRKANKSGEFGFITSNDERSAAAKAAGVFMTEYLRFTLDENISAVRIPMAPEQPVKVTVEPIQGGVFDEKQAEILKKALKDRITAIFRRESVLV